MMEYCYCGSKINYSLCCEPFILRKNQPSHPVALMRSRYTAFILKDIDYLWSTHDPETVHNLDLDANKNWAISVQFTKLEVLKSQTMGTRGVVQFRAHYIELISGKNRIHNELSQFRNIKGVWYYSNGNTD